MLGAQSCPTLHNSMDYSLQAPLSMRFSRQKYESELPCPPLGDLPNWGIKLASVFVLCIADRFFCPLSFLGSLYGLYILNIKSQVSET